MIHHFDLAVTYQITVHTADNVHGYVYVSRKVQWKRKDLR